MEVRCEKCRHRMEVAIPENQDEMHLVCSFCGTPFTWVRPVPRGAQYGQVPVPRLQDEDEVTPPPVDYIIPTPAPQADQATHTDAEAAPHQSHIVQMYRCGDCHDVYDMGLSHCPHCGCPAPQEPPTPTAPATPRHTEPKPAEQDEPLTIVQPDGENQPSPKRRPKADTVYQPQHGQTPRRQLVIDHPRRRGIAALLAFLFGALGIHHFYLRNYLLGTLCLLLCWTLVPGIVAFFEGVYFLFCTQESFDRRYNLPHAHYEYR